MSEHNKQAIDDCVKVLRDLQFHYIQACQPYAERIAMLRDLEARVVYLDKPIGWKPPLRPEQIPDHIHKAALELDLWFSTQGHTEWELHGVMSRRPT